MRTTTQQGGDPVLSRRTLLGSAVVSALGNRLAHAADPSYASRVSPSAAWQQLVEGNARFAEGNATGPRRDLTRVSEVAGTQKPFAAILGCADSRVPLEIVFDQGVGDLFVVRNAGNVVTSEGIASLEYGTLVLGASVPAGLRPQRLRRGEGDNRRRRRARPDQRALPAHHAGVYDLASGRMVPLQVCAGRHGDRQHRAAPPVATWRHAAVVAVSSFTRTEAPRNRRSAAPTSSRAPTAERITSTAGTDVCIWPRHGRWRASTPAAASASA